MAKSKDDEVPEGLGNKEERLKRTRELGALEVLGQRLIAKPWNLQKLASREALGFPMLGSTPDGAARK